MPTEHKSWPYRRAADALKAQRLQPCALCSEVIDYRATSPDERSFSAEHVVPVRHGGTWRDGLLPAHLGCQREQGGRARAGLDDVVSEPRSGVWG